MYRAVKIHVSAFKYASEELRADKEVVLEAVKSRTEALRYASTELVPYKSMQEIFNFVDENQDL